MTWHESLGRVVINGRSYIGGSFRGVPFFVESSERSGGRAGPDHEFVFRDIPFSEDTGRKQRAFQVDAYTLGDDCLADAERLTRALEDEEGPGDLRHPYHGKRQCVCRGFTRRDTPSEGRIVRFSITFRESPPEAAFPLSVLDKAAALKQKAEAAITTVGQAYQDAYDASALPTDYLTSAENIVRDAGRAMKQPFSDLVERAEDLAEFRRRVDRLIENAANLVRVPFDAFDAIRAALEVAFAPPKLPRVFRDLLSMGDVDFSRLPSPPAMTPNRVREADNFRLTAAMLRRVNVCRVSAIAADASFPDFELARQTRAAIITRLQEETEEAEDAVYVALVDLAVAVNEGIPLPDQQLPQRRMVVPPVTTSSLVFAHRVYGDVSREPEIVTRNRLNHPGFVVGGVPVEVLSNGEA